MPHRLRVCILAAMCAAAAAMPPSVHAATGGADFESGKRAYETGDFKVALTALEQAFDATPGDIEVNFYLGLTAMALKDYERAAMAFERVLITAPERPRVKLELARSYFHLGLNDVAEGYFREVLDDEPPEGVKATVELFLEQLRRRRKRHVYSGRLSLGVQRDTNVRISPAGDSVQTTEVLYELSEADKKARDTLGTTLFIFNHEFRPDAQTRRWRSTFIGYSALYQNETDLDLTYLSVLTGPSWQTQRYRFDLQATYAWLQRDYLTYLRSYGVAPSLSIALSENVMIDSALRIEQRSRHEDDEQDSVIYSFAVTPLIRLGPTRIAVRLLAERDNSSDDTESYNKFAGRLYVQRELPRHVSVFAGYEISDSIYEERDVLFDNKRNDTVQEYEVGIRKRLGPRAEVELSHQRTSSESTQDLYDYERNVTSFTFSVNF